MRTNHNASGKPSLEGCAGLRYLPSVGITSHIPLGVWYFDEKTLEEDFDVAPEDSQQLAEQAYDRYCEGNGETEYECIEAVYSESGEDEEKLIRPATCQECFHCISFHGINEKYCEYIHEYLNDFSYCDHICSDMIYEVFVSGKSKGLWYVEGYDTDEELALAFCEEFGCASADKIRLECMAEE